MRINNLHSYFRPSSPNQNILNSNLLSPSRVLADRKKRAKKKVKPPSTYSTTQMCHLNLLNDQGVIESE
jgi:hypothetical protein